MRLQRLHVSSDLVPMDFGEWFVDPSLLFFIDSLTHSLTHKQPLTRSFTRSLTHSLTHLLIYHYLSHSLTHQQRLSDHYRLPCRASTGMYLSMYVCVCTYVCNGRWQSRGLPSCPRKWQYSMKKTIEYRSIVVDGGSHWGCMSGNIKES